MAVLEAREIVKSYTGQLALKGVSLRLETGRIYGLVGHNGAGKSTLLRVVSGVERPTSGGLALDGREVKFGSPLEAAGHGVASVYQELRVIGSLTVAENIFLGHEPRRGMLVDRDTMNRLAAGILNRYGLALRPDVSARSLSHAQRQIIEIIAALERQATFILLDEPTSALESQQIDELLSRLQQTVRQQDVAVVLVTHKLSEVFRIADAVTVLRNGEVVLAESTSHVSLSEVASLMIGEDVANPSTAPAPALVKAAPPSHGQRQGEGAASPDRFFQATNVETARVRDVSLSVQRGTVVGLYGLVGAGRTEFLHGVYGLDPLTRGTMHLDGRPYRPRSPGDAIREGVAYVTEDRRVNGLIPELNAVENVTLPVADRLARLGVVNRRRQREVALSELRAIRLNGSADQPVKYLSGGNQQKVLLARASLQGPDLLLLDEPTKGIDIGVKEEIYHLIDMWAHERGITIIVASSEEEEILRVSDEVAIFAGRRCVEVLPNAGLSSADLRRMSSRESVLA